MYSALFPRFNEQKATELTALLLSWNDGAIEYIKGLKIIYLIDRKALQQEGYSISTDSWVSMKHGPVPSQIYSLICQEDNPELHLLWGEQIKTGENYCIHLQKPFPGVRFLSKLEIEIAQQIWEEYRQMDVWGERGIVEFTHTLEEWDEPVEGGPQSTPIQLERILKAVGKSKEGIQAILDVEKTNAWLETQLAVSQ